MKKMLTLLFAVVMVLTTAASASAAAFADTAGKTCETAVEVLASLGIVEGKAEGAYEPDSVLTRAEMTTIILRTMNMAAGAAGRDIFADVPSSHWAYANVAAAYQLGIVNGTSATTFEPDKTVTYEQAVKMVVAALGYTVQAEAAGGYPSGYLSKASQLDLLKGVAMESDMTRGNMAVLVYNALDIELFLQTEFGDVAYGESDETLLSYYLKVTKHTGKKLTATPMAQISAPSRRLLNDEVAMETIIMKKGETNAQDMLGVRSDIYTKLEDESHIPVILAIVPRASAEVIDLSAQDIDGKSSKQEIIYTDAEGNEREITVGEVTFIHNGSKTDITNELLKPEIGTVRIISDGGDVETIIVWSYENHVVESVLVDDNTVKFKDRNKADLTGTELDSPMVIDLTDNSSSISLTDADGQPLTLSDLAEWDVLSVAKDKAENPTILRIYRSNKMVSGTVSEISADEVTIDGTVYTVADPPVVGEIQLGQAAAYYLDFTGAIAAVDETYDTAGKTYGWLAGAAFTKGLSGKPQLKIFTQDGEWKVFDLTDNVLFNDDNRDSASLLDVEKADTDDKLWSSGNAPTLIDKGGTVVPQLILYKTNAEGKITEIETAQNKSDPNALDQEKIGAKFSMDWFYNNQADGAAGYLVEYNGKTETGWTEGSELIEDLGKKNPTTAEIENIQGIFMGKVWTNDSTKFFIIPSDLSRDKDYEIRPLSEFGREETLDSDFVSFYDVDEDYYCGAMVMHNYMGSVDKDTYPAKGTTLAVVTGLSTTLSEDGEVQNTLKLYNSAGQEVSVTVEEGFYALYGQANADVNADEEWYSVDKDTGERKTHTKGEIIASRPATMYIDIEDLDYGDVIQYEADTSGKLTRASVCFRANYSALKMEMYITTNNKLNQATSSVLNYMSGGKVLINGEVVNTVEIGPIVEVHPTVDGCSIWKDLTYTRTLSSKGRFVLWDRQTETLRAITAADILEGDELFAYWNNMAQMMVVVYRGEK